MYKAESIPRIRATGILEPAVPHRRTILRANQRLLDHGQFTAPSHSRGRGRPALALEIEDDIIDIFIEADPRARVIREMPHGVLS